MKYFTVASICIVVVLFITLAKEIEMKSLERAEIQDGQLRTIMDPMTDLKGINFLSFFEIFLHDFVGYDIFNAIWNYL